MTKKRDLKFYGDENVPLPSIKFLRSKGFSAKHAKDFGLVGKRISDKKHVRKSKELGYILVSLDFDFKRWLQEGRNLKDHPGILVLTGTFPTPEEINALLLKTIPNITTTMLKESILIASKDQVKKVRIDNETGQITSEEL